MVLTRRQTRERQEQQQQQEQEQQQQEQELEAQKQLKEKEGQQSPCHQQHLERHMDAVSLPETPLTSVLTPKSTNATNTSCAMRGSAKKGVLSHPLVLEEFHACGNGTLEKGCEPPQQEERMARAAIPASEDMNGTAGMMRSGRDIEPAGVGQENRLPTGQEPAVVEITYPLIEDMVALENHEDIESMVRQVGDELQSTEWTIVCSGMNGLRRLAGYHPMECRGLVSGAMPSIVRGIKSPRSALSKSAIITSRDLFACLPDAMGAYVDCTHVEPGSLLTQLLLKAASNDKRFVVEEAVKSLEQMASSVDPLITVKSLIAFAGHKNPKVRGKCCVLLLRVIQGDTWRPGMVLDVGLDRIVHMCADGTNDNTAEARESSRKILHMMKEWVLVEEVKTYMIDSQSRSTDDQIEVSCDGVLSSWDPLIVGYLRSVVGTSKATLLLQKLR